MDADESALDELIGLGSPGSPLLDLDKDGAAFDAVSDLGACGAAAVHTGASAVFAAARRQRLQTGCAVKLHDARKRQQQHETTVAPSVETPVSFNINKGAEDIESNLVSSLVFGKAHGLSISAMLSSHGPKLTARRGTRVRVVTKYRYMGHQRRAPNNMLEDGLPSAAIVESLRLKWDETEQVVGTGIGILSGPDAAQKSTARVVGVWFKTAPQQCPSLWPAPPRMLERTTAECTWKALASSTPFGPWSQLPGPELAKFIVLAWCADEASANKRLFAQALRKAQLMRDNVLLVFNPCVLHILHRSVVPIIRHNSRINELFRAAHLLQVAVASYVLGFTCPGCASVAGQIRSCAAQCRSSNWRQFGVRTDITVDDLRQPAG